MSRVIAVGFILAISACLSLAQSTIDLVGHDESPIISGDVTPTGTQVLLYNTFGGTWYDAEKSTDNTEDDYLCWAAQAANMLAWSGFGYVNGMTTTDQMFQYFQDHWTDVGSSARYALDWWFDGTNNGPTSSIWSQVDVPGGGFFPNKNIWDYLVYSTYDPDAMSNIDTWIKSGHVIGLNILGTLNGSAVSHAITCWGFDVNPSNPTDYLGVWVTDSDDSKSGVAPRPDVLHYYEVEYQSGHWYLQSYYGCDTIYISEVMGLSAIPEPTTVSLLLLGSVAMLLRHKRRR